MINPSIFLFFFPNVMITAVIFFRPRCGPQKGLSVDTNGLCARPTCCSGVRLQLWWDQHQAPRGRQHARGQELRRASHGPHLLEARNLQDRPAPFQASRSSKNRKNGPTSSGRHGCRRGTLLCLENAQVAHGIWMPGQNK